jgi:hypothetical protein
VASIADHGSPIIGEGATVGKCACPDPGGAWQGHLRRFAAFAETTAPEVVLCSPSSANERAGSVCATARVAP